MTDCSSFPEVAFPEFVGALAQTRIVPVLTLDDSSWAGELASILWEGGVRVMEVTLRTPAALAALEAMVKAVPDAHVGAGTILDPDDLIAAVDRGATFAVSPGQTPALLNAASSTGIPFVPGVATPSEMMTARAAGFTLQKFFPAEVAGGIGMLQAVGAPLSDLTFWPTGGIELSHAPDYLALSNVIAVGSSRLIPQDAIQRRDADAVQEHLRALDL